MDNKIHHISFSDSDMFQLALFQWDKGQVFYFDDEYPAGTEVQFSDGSINVIVNNKISFPDRFLQTATADKCYVQIIGSDNETTIKTISYKVKPRPQKSDYVNPEDQNTFRSDIQALVNQAIAAGEEATDIAQSVRDDADSGVFDGTDYDHSAEYAALTAQMAQYQQQVNTDRAAITSLVSDAEDYADSAEESANSAAESAERAEQVATNNGYFYFDINAAGHLIETRTDNVSDDITFALTNGKLEVTYV